MSVEFFYLNIQISRIPAPRIQVLFTQYLLRHMSKSFEKGEAHLAEMFLLI